MNAPILVEFHLPSGAVRPAIIAGSSSFARAALYVFTTSADSDDLAALGIPHPGGAILYIEDVPPSQVPSPACYTPITPTGRRVT